MCLAAAEVGLQFDNRIAARAAEIWRETGGAPFDNWIRAERELGA